MHTIPFLVFITLTNALIVEDVLNNHAIKVKNVEQIAYCITLQSGVYSYEPISGASSNMTSTDVVSGQGVFTSSGGSGTEYAGFVPAAEVGDIKSSTTFVLMKVTMQYPNLNTQAQMSCDVDLYHENSLFDLFPRGDFGTLRAVLNSYNEGLTQPLLSDDALVVFSKNIITLMHNSQHALLGV